MTGDGERCPMQWYGALYSSARMALGDLRCGDVEHAVKMLSVGIARDAAAEEAGYPNIYSPEGERLWDRFKRLMAEVES